MTLEQKIQLLEQRIAVLENRLNSLPATPAVYGPRPTWQNPDPTYWQNPDPTYWPLPTAWCEAK